MGKVKDLKAAAVKLLEMQEIWIEWISEEKAGKDDLKALKALKKWIGSWKSSKLKNIESRKTGRPDLLLLLEAGEEITDASRKFSDRLMGNGFSGKVGTLEKPLNLILSPLPASGS